MQVEVEVVVIMVVASVVQVAAALVEDPALAELLQQPIQDQVEVVQEVLLQVVLERRVESLLDISGHNRKHQVGQ
jgi:hypothetical protein